MGKVRFASPTSFQQMFLFFVFLLNSPVCLSYYSANKFQFACVGQDVHIAVDSRSSLVTFDRADWQVPRKVLLENTRVKDLRYEWMRNMTLVIRNVTHDDQGLYSIKSPLTGFTFETVRLTISECLNRFSRNYGETFKMEIPQGGDTLEFQGSFHFLASKSSSSSPSSEPVVLWKRAGSEVEKRSSGTLRDRYWVIDSVVPVDQGNYTIKDSNGTVVSKVSLTVRAHTFNLTLYSKDSLFIFMWVPEAFVQLHFSPAQQGPVGSSLLLQAGEVVQDESRYRGRLSLHRNSTGTYMVIAVLSRKDDGTYKLLDGDGNLVSSTVITVIERHTKWRAVIKSISVPSGMFAALAAFILFMKRYPRCSVNNIMSGLRDRHSTSTLNSPTLLVQDSGEQGTAYSSLFVYDSNSTINKPRLSLSGYSAIADMEQYLHASRRVPIRENEARTDSAVHDVEQKMSILVPGRSDYLQPSDCCVEFDIRRNVREIKDGKGDDYFSALPLNADTSLICSVYNSEKLNFFFPELVD